MATALRAGLVGDFDPTVTAHQAIPMALRLAAAELETLVEPVWLPTPAIAADPGILDGVDGFWCVPASPYASMEGALTAIRHARLNGIPFLGTCGGFQHALVEYARNVHGLVGADHEETAPDSATLVITRLRCSLVEQSEELRLADAGLLRAAYGCDRITEQYRCSFGLNPAFESLLLDGRLTPAAWDLAGNLRAVELRGHPFFAATLFQHERRALRGETPPPVRAFVQAMSARAA